jgi:hypothetical protein
VSEPIPGAQGTCPDVVVTQQWFGALVTTNSRAGERWLAANFIPDSHPLGGSLLVPVSHAPALIRAMRIDGLGVHMRGFRARPGLDLSRLLGRFRLW